MLSRGLESCTENFAHCQHAAAAAAGVLEAAGAVAPLARTIDGLTFQLKNKEAASDGAYNPLTTLPGKPGGLPSPMAWVVTVLVAGTPSSSHSQHWQPWVS